MAYSSHTGRLLFSRHPTRASWLRFERKQPIILITMTTQRLALAIVVQIVVFGFGLYLSRSDRKLQRGIGIALQILSVLLIVISLIRWGMSD